MVCLPKSRGTSAHDFALAHQFGVELGAVQREVYVKVYAVEGALRRVHALKVLFEVLAREVRGQGHDFFYARVFGVFGTIDFHVSISFLAKRRDREELDLPDILVAGV